MGGSQDALGQDAEQAGRRSVVVQTLWDGPGRPDIDVPLLEPSDCLFLTTCHMSRVSWLLLILTRPHASSPALRSNSS